MDWLNQAFAEQSIAWLLITSVVALASGFLSSWLTYRYVKRQEIIDQTTLEGKVRQEVEAFLGDRSAEREYNLEARKRLYQAIGPLRFQLVIACDDAASRVAYHGRHYSGHSMIIDNYYGRNTLYRLLRPLAIAELVEQQITYADFSVDPKALELLRFKQAAEVSLKDSEVILDHPNADWSDQIEHLFSGTLNRLANSLTVPDENASNKRRPMHFHEFEDFIRDRKNQPQFAPLIKILQGFTITTKPIFWARLVCFGYLCNEYVRKEGKTVGFAPNSLDLEVLLRASEDPYILANIEGFKEVFQSLAKS
jgi:hypothetical protein